jgi:hypothetical protein
MLNARNNYSLTPGLAGRYQDTFNSLQNRNLYINPGSFDQAIQDQQNSQLVSQGLFGKLVKKGGKYMGADLDVTDKTKDITKTVADTLVQAGSRFAPLALGWSILNPPLAAGTLTEAQKQGYVKPKY